jgi:hypothetical protein
MKNKKFIFYTRRDEISKISLFFGPGRHAMSVGPKWRDYGRFGLLGHDCHRCGIAMPPWARSLTFLVLGPIDLTNGRASMMEQLPFTLRGTVWMVLHLIKLRFWVNFKKTPSFRQAPNVYNVTIIFFLCYDACVTHLSCRKIKKS